jgi:hypothetical protein
MSDRVVIPTPTGSKRSSYATVLAIRKLTGQRGVYLVTVEQGRSAVRAPDRDERTGEMIVALNRDRSGESVGWVERAENGWWVALPMRKRGWRVGRPLGLYPTRGAAAAALDGSSRYWDTRPAIRPRYGRELREAVRRRRDSRAARTWGEGRLL